MEKTYKVRIRRKTIDPKGSMVMKLIDDLKEGDYIKIKSIIGHYPVRGSLPVYADTIEGENIYGGIEEMTYDGETLDSEEIKQVIDSPYELRVSAREGNVFIATLITKEDDITSNDTPSEEIDKAIETIVNAGIMEKSDIDERIKIMRDNSVDNDLILRVISGYRKYNKASHKPSCIYVDPSLAESQKLKTEGIIAEGLRAAVERTAVICEGEKSVGKNVYVETIAYLMGMPLYLITFSRQMSPSSIYGEKTTDNSAAEVLEDFDPSWLKKAQMIRDRRQIEGIADILKGSNEARSYTKEEMEVLDKEAEFKKLNAMSQSVHIKIDQSELYDWLIDGGLMVFNEMNMAEANFLASFANQLLDGTGFLFIPGRGEIPIHPDCMLFGTQNADYQGVEQQNEATMSRFGCIEFPQPESIKAQIKAATASALKKCGYKGKVLDDIYFKQCQQFYAQCHSAVKKGTLSNACLNIRGFVRALTTVTKSSGHASLKRQIEIHVINTCPYDERSALKTILLAICDR